VRGTDEPNLVVWVSALDIAACRSTPALVTLVEMEGARRGISRAKLVLDARGAHWRLGSIAELDRLLGLLSAKFVHRGVILVDSIDMLLAWTLAAPLSDTFAVLDTRFHAGWARSAAEWLERE
jgi:hypothetical protein